MVSADRIFKILDTEDFIPDTGTLDQSSTPFPAQVDIEFKNVWFAYNEEEWVLKNVSFHVPPGKTYALVGATGSGKTSIINVLSRFYPIQSGEISIHHIPIEQFKLNWLRSQIVTVHQDVFLFSGSVKDNITLNHPDITYEQVVAAAKSIGADEFIQQLPGGYDYTVKERGATLSTGQRQLISFARALVYNPKILVLDEATSSIDTETELLIQKAIEKLMQGRTSLIIAHRLSTIQKSDCILVLHNGEIIEQGTHAELIRKDGKYRKLYELQYA
jgi:ATP-binding cassette subfamily B protein